MRRTHSMVKNKKTPLVISIFLFVICLALMIFVQTQPKVWIDDMDAIAVKRGRIITYHISQALVDYMKENNGDCPDKISDLIPLYLTPESLLGSKIEGWLKVSGTDMRLWPEAMDVTGFASIYPKKGGEFIVALSPVLYGSDSVPFFYYRPQDHTDGIINYYTMDYKMLDLVQVCKLIRSFQNGSRK